MDNQKKTTGFTNISDIVRANRENRLGKTVKSGVSKVVGQGQQQLQNSQNQFQQGAQQNQIGTAADQAYVNQTINGPQQQTQQVPGTTGSTVSGAQQQTYVPNIQQSDVDRFAKLRSGQYQGPTELGNREELAARGQELQGISQAATTEQGRRGLLQRFVAPQQQYTQGQQRLDNLLLGQTGGQATRQARQQSNLYNQQLTDADRAAMGQGQAYQQQAQQFGQNVNQQLGQAQTKQQTDLQARAQQQQQGAEAARAALNALFSRASTNPQQPSGEFSTMPVGNLQRPTITQAQYDQALPLLEQAGLTNKNIYGANNYYQPGDPNSIIGDMGANLTATPDQVANEQDKARAAALAQLSGKNQEFLTGQVGGYNPLSFLQKDNLDKYLAQNKSEHTFDASSINNPNDYLLGGYNPGIDYSKVNYSSQGQAIQNLAKQLQETDPVKAAQYQKAANELNAYASGGKGHLNNLDKNVYKQILNSGLSDTYENNKTTLLDRLKGLID